MDGQTVTITEGGMYLLTGSLSNGSVVVDTDKTEKVQLILKNVSIINEEGTEICVEQANKVFITLADGSTNKIVSNSFVENEDTNIDGAIFSREDLTLNGSGTLKITSAAHGIVSKDDLVLTGGVYQIQSEKQGLSGKESVRIADGTFTITSGTDAIHSEDTDQSGEIILKDTDGTVLVSYTPVRGFNSVVISCEELEEGAAYTPTTGSESEKITMSSLVYSEEQSMQGLGQGGPGTAIGVIGDRHYLFVVADGRTSESEGLSLYELAQITKKNIYTYGVVVLFCIFGTKIYEQFSYGEYSLYMRSMFWFPLAGGMALAMLFYKLERTVSRKSFLLWNSGIAALTVGCLVRGIITISGRSSSYDRYYWFAGVVFLQ